MARLSSLAPSKPAAPRGAAALFVAREIAAFLLVQSTGKHRHSKLGHLIRRVGYALFSASSVAVVLRCCIYHQWVKGLFQTLISAALCFRWLPFQREILRARKDAEYCVWWPRFKARSGERCWVLIPGGMSSGRDFYITSMGTSAVIAAEESWVVFHNPGQGGSREISSSFRGLTRTDCLSDFLQRIRDQFRSIVVVGFSAGGMPVMNMAQQENPIADAFVSICTPDKIRRVFEEQSRLWFRLDVFFAIWFHLCARQAGIVATVPFRKFPWPPTWAGYMRPFVEHHFLGCTGFRQSFEEFETQHFDGSIKQAITVPCLRIWSKDDPIVAAHTLEHGLFKNCEVWWEDGGHCGQFFWSADLADRLRTWVLQSGFRTRSSEDA